MASLSIAPFLQPAFFGGGWGGPEVLLILFVVLILFGPKQLPQIARNIGRALDQLRRASNDFKDQVMKIEDEIEKEVVGELPEHEEEPPIEENRWAHIGEGMRDEDSAADEKDVTPGEEKGGTDDKLAG
jgi:sec-independent protein translocase protein TatA